MKITKKEPRQEIDFNELVTGFMSQYETIFFDDLEDTIFVYRPLGRKEYKNIMLNDNLNAFEKEEEICKIVMLWPQDFDFDSCLAGTPTTLYKNIVAKSFLKDTTDMIYLIESFRNESEELDSQMSCIISECFPNYTLDEIESWDMVKFCRMYAKAEWKMNNLRSMALNTDIVEFLQSSLVQGTEPEETSNTINEAPAQQEEVLPNGKKKMTPEMAKAYNEARMKFPEIDWSADAMFTGYETQGADTTAPALRTGWGR
jgi:hypothetical protein